MLAQRRPTPSYRFLDHPIRGFRHGFSAVLDQLTQTELPFWVGRWAGPSCVSGQFCKRHRTPTARALHRSPSPGRLVVRLVGTPWDAWRYLTMPVPR